MGGFSLCVGKGPYRIHKKPFVSVFVPGWAKRACHVCVSDNLSQKKAVFGGAHGGGKDNIHSIPRIKSNGRGDGGNALLSDGKDDYAHGGAGVFWTFAGTWDAD